MSDEDMLSVKRRRAVASKERDNGDSSDSEARGGSSLKKAQVSGGCQLISNGSLGGDRVERG